MPPHATKGFYMRITNGRVFNGQGFEDADVLVNGDRFVAEYDYVDDGIVIDAAGCIVAPGLIDLHFHGAMGYETTTDDARAMDAIGAQKLREGVTSCCPTTLTLPEEKLAASLAHIESYRRQPSGAQVLGVHLEGPYVVS